MHTSTVLAAGDFRYWRRVHGELTQVDFETCFPGYCSMDRIGVVSPHVEDGAFSTCYALLAATTRFYDVLRARGGEFYDYPHHFCFVDVSSEGVLTHGGRIALEEKAFDVWSGLDVWPESQWIHGSLDAREMIGLVFSKQINCLFWPEKLKPSVGVKPFPAYVKPLLEARLKTVYYYDSEDPDTEVHVSQNVENLIQEWCRSKLPVTVDRKYEKAEVLGENKEFPYVERYRQVPVDQFLSDMESFFTCDSNKIPDLHPQL